jgi:hypothetical protein
MPMHVTGPFQQRGVAYEERKFSQHSQRSSAGHTPAIHADAGMTVQEYQETLKDQLFQLPPPYLLVIKNLNTKVPIKALEAEFQRLAGSHDCRLKVLFNKKLKIYLPFGIATCYNP